MHGEQKLPSNQDTSENNMGNQKRAVSVSICKTEKKHGMYVEEINL